MGSKINRTPFDAVILTLRNEGEESLYLPLLCLLANTQIHH